MAKRVDSFGLLKDERATLESALSNLREILDERNIGDRIQDLEYVQDLINRLVPKISEGDLDAMLALEEQL